jgi:hypothetical protein
MKLLFVLHLGRSARCFCVQAEPAFKFKFNHASTLTRNSVFSLAKRCLFAKISDQVDFRQYAHLMCSFRAGKYT